MSERERDSKMYTPISGCFYLCAAMSEEMKAKYKNTMKPTTTELCDYKLYCYMSTTTVPNTLSAGCVVCAFFSLLLISVHDSNSLLHSVGRATQLSKMVVIVKFVFV